MRKKAGSPIKTLCASSIPCWYQATGSFQCIQPLGAIKINYPTDRQRMGWESGWYLTGVWMVKATDIKGRVIEEKGTSMPAINKQGFLTEENEENNTM